MWANYDYTRLDDELTTFLVREAEWIQHNQNVGRGITADSAFFARSLNTAFLTQAQARQ